MTDLRKIGFGAFSNCTALKRSSSSLTYTYEVYAKSGDSGETFTPVTNGTSITDGVIDLTKCTKLRNIGIQAFSSCTSIKYVHLPNTVNGAKNVESKLYVAKDPDDSMTFGGSRSAFTGSDTAILIGECPAQATSAAGNTYKPDDHYDNTCFGSNQRYYHITEASDTISGADTVNYWTKYNEKYILFRTTTDANWFFSKGHVPDATQF